ncbi:MAG: hypothetical protein JWN66_4955 [Sphingomonas bacterium]|uniref:hypothetical protein n=1 Tax=Sphingomonas bacterium TaxID=1895847 RepID=UPI002614665C|nr:hypothetical protein [Sphingomonas bacterium]MDB5707839.1 hypothetical protein [Sphingomonas bacterium]
MNRARIQTGGQIFEVVDSPEGDVILLTVSKARWDEDNIQFQIPRHVARALGAMLIGETEGAFHA